MSSGIVVLKLAPMETETKTLDEVEKQLYRKIFMCINKKEGMII